MKIRYLIPLLTLILAGCVSSTDEKKSVDILTHIGNQYHINQGDNSVNFSVFEFETKKDLRTTEKYGTEFLTLTKTEFYEYFKNADIEDAELISEVKILSEYGEKSSMSNNSHVSYIKSIETIENNETGEISTELSTDIVTFGTEISFFVNKTETESKELEINFYSSKLLSIKRTEIDNDNYIEAPNLSLRSFDTKVLYTGDLYLVSIHSEKGESNIFQSDETLTNIIIVKVQ